MSNHIQTVLAQWWPARDTRQWVLGVVTHTEGSSYRKAGAMMLLNDLGQSLGLLSGGCLERALLAEVKRVLAFNRPRDITFDATQESELAWAWGLGCGGRVSVRLLPVSAANHYLQLDQILRQLQRRQAVRYGVPLGDVGAQAPWQPQRPSDPSCSQRQGDCLWVPLTPQHHLVVFGAGVDVVPLAQMATALGWQLTLIDHRISAAKAAAFPASAQWLCYEPDDPRLAQVLASADAAMVMTHNIALDGRALTQLVGTPLAYLGLLGPEHRKQRVLAEARLDESRLPVPLDGPMGLDLGGELPESVALSALAKCHQVLAGRANRASEQLLTTPLERRCP